MSLFMIIIQGFLWASLLGNVYMFIKWCKAKNEVRSIKENFIKDLFLIRGGYGN